MNAGFIRHIIVLCHSVHKGTRARLGDCGWFRCPTSCVYLANDDEIACCCQMYDTELGFEVLGSILSSKDYCRMTWGQIVAMALFFENLGKFAPSLYSR